MGLQESGMGMPEPTLEAKRTWVLVVVLIGVMMIAADTTIVMLALPPMTRGLHASLTAIGWVSMAYVLAMTLSNTQVGRMGDMYGRVRMYQSGFVIFIVSSLICGLSGSADGVIVFRATQGVGGALMTANSGAILADAFPAQLRGLAYGWQNLGWNLGAVLGILLGGVLTTYLSWRYIFWINVPIGVFVLLISLRILRETSRRQQRRLDMLGMGLLGVGLLGMLLTMTELNAAIGMTRIVVQFAASLLILGVFVWVEKRHPQPMLNLALFRIPRLSASLTAFFLQSLGNYAVLFLMMLYLQGVRHMSPIAAAVLLVPGYMVSGVSGAFAGRLSDRYGATIPATVGLGLQGLGVFLYAQAGLRTPWEWIMLAAVINGLGSGSFFPANSAALMKAAPADSYGIAYGMLRTFGNIGQVLSFALALMVAGGQLPQKVAASVYNGMATAHGSQVLLLEHGVHSALYLSLCFFLAAAGASLLRGEGRDPAVRSPVTGTVSG